MIISNYQCNIESCFCDNWKPSFLPCLIFHWLTFSRQQKIKCWPIRTWEISGIRLSEELYERLRYWRTASYFHCFRCVFLYVFVMCVCLCVYRVKGEGDGTTKRRYSPTKDGLNSPLLAAKIINPTQSSSLLSS